MAGFRLAVRTWEVFGEQGLEGLWISCITIHSNDLVGFTRRYSLLIPSIYSKTLPLPIKTKQLMSETPKYGSYVFFSITAFMNHY